MNLNEIAIRPYLDKDYDELALNLKEGELFSPFVDTKNNLLKMIQNDPQSILVAEFDGKIIGNVYILYSPWSSFIFRLAVMKEFRKKGIGFKLICESEKIL